MAKTKSITLALALRPASACIAPTRSVETSPGVFEIVVSGSALAPSSKYINRLEAKAMKLCPNDYRVVNKPTSETFSSPVYVNGMVSYTHGLRFKMKVACKLFSGY